MAVTRKTQKDIGNHEAKFLGPLTMRQTAIIGIFAIPSIIAYFIIYGITNDFYISCVGLIFMLPAAFLAFGKDACYGMNPEDYLIEWYFYHFKAPGKRTYKTKTVDDNLFNERVAKLKKEKAKQDNLSKSKKVKIADEDKIVIPETGFVKYPHPQKEDTDIKAFE